ncbi:WD40-repeat-containing domain protein [Chaetomidium leptoderma]|uniref:WD40-repeat-containing domain protein n=1 Tax=Chaetomidium leptoderma TaxID=669021 RepID=A0AAN6VFM6_9PEZI|nr:WD40-repeat-containing domain protein [Chaetomidium leptoderma]
MKELLDTDRVNFLVWRYLLESNYRETAAKLQKEWRIHQPHRQFDFASHVNTYALVSLLNKGLIYEDYQRQFAAAQTAPRDVPATADATARGVFGPLKFQPEVVDEDDEDDDGEFELEDPEPEEMENPRKRTVERQQHHHHELSHGSPTKRQRLSNGYENGADSATTPMEIDHHPDNNHAYPSPLEGEQAESPLLRTEGPSRGTQVEKVHDLTQGTVFLRLGADESSEAGENPIVLLCEWNPRDPSVLATAGTDALARIWTLPCGTGPDAEPGHVDANSRSFMSIVEEDLPKNATVSAMAWSSSGDLIALGTELGNKSRVSIWSVDGTSMHRFDGLDTPVTNLCWSPNNNFLLAVSPDLSSGIGSSGTLVHISSPSMVNSMSHVLHHNLRTDNLDATWISETEFLLCGGDLLVTFRCTEQGIVQGREFQTDKDERFTVVEFDWRSQLVATASDKGYIDIWDGSGKRRTIPAHDGGVTSLKWQPLQAEPADDERLLVSGGEDGAILVWNVRSAENKPKYSITMPPPLAVNNLSMSPDGTCIAVATHDRIMVWKMGDHAMPKASWVPQSGWQSPSSGTDSEDPIAIPCLGWDSEGQRLVYGLDNRLAVISLREHER